MVDDRSTGSNNANNNDAGESQGEAYNIDLENPVDIGGAFQSLIGAIVGDSDRTTTPANPSTAPPHDPNVCVPCGSKVAPADRAAFGAGCMHYNRFCRLVAPCCDQVFSCRHCHNEQMANCKTPHELDRKAVKEVICNKCNHKQAPAHSCEKCGQEFASYFCQECNFWDGEGIEKEVFHCADCGICRVGGRENYFHCYTCGSCYPNDIRDSHKCVENAMKQNCPICQDDLFQSVKQVTILRCGHTIHQECLIKLRSSTSGLQSLRCPMCMTSFEAPEDLSHVWQQIDHELLATPMPAEYSNVAVSIQCNDCHVSSTVPFHILALKCPHCNSYNTRREGVFAQEDANDQIGFVPGEFEPLLEAGPADIPDPDIENADLIMSSPSPSPVDLI